MADLDAEVLHEAPEDLKRLIRLITRGFYSMEHAFIVDLLVRNPCVKEDDMVDVLQYDRKQLRQHLNTLKNDKFIKARMRMETDIDGRTTRHNYYFINYSMFVNVVKYKLDHMRKKIEMEERDNTSRASFKCPQCHKTYTDLDTGQLLDPMTQTLVCTFCAAEVQEDMSAVSRPDARTLLAKFNDQIEPIYELLRLCENLKLAPEVLEPEPTDLKRPNKDRSASAKNTENKHNLEDIWSGSQSKDVSFGTRSTETTVSLTGDEKQVVDRTKNTPIWMKASTVEGVAYESQAAEPAIMDTGLSSAQLAGSADHHDIMRTLMAHETSAANPVGSGGHSDSSDNEAGDTKAPLNSSDQSGAVEEMESDDDDDSDPLVTIGDRKYTYHEITEDMVARMTPSEKEEYIRIGQELYQNLYE